MTEKYYFKIVDDYLVEYDGDYFDLHKPSDIRSMVRIMNRIINVMSMTEKTTEMIDNEIEQVMNQFECVEDIIGRIANENGRHRLVHRELRTFTWFVGYMICGRELDEVEDDFDTKFKKEYDNFFLGDDSDDAYDLYKWACLYWIYNKKWEETDEYKELEEMV